MPSDPAQSVNTISTESDFRYEMDPTVIRIWDCGYNDKKPVADDLTSVLRKIEYWHQGSIAGFRIMHLTREGVWEGIAWDGQTVGFLALSETDQRLAERKLKLLRPRPDERAV